MKKIILVLVIIAASGFAGWQLNTIHRHETKVYITRFGEDERGLTSIEFIQDGQEYALDYLTAQEFLNIANQ